MRRLQLKLWRSCRRIFITVWGCLRGCFHEWVSNLQCHSAIIVKFYVAYIFMFRGLIQCLKQKLFVLEAPAWGLHLKWQNRWRGFKEFLWLAWYPFSKSSASWYLVPTADDWLSNQKQSYFSEFQVCIFMRTQLPPQQAVFHILNNN